MTAEKAPPTASERASRPAIRSATSSAAEQHQADQEAERAGAADVDTPGDARCDQAADVAREPPAEGDERERGDDPDGLVEAEQLDAEAVGGEHGDDQRDREQQLAARRRARGLVAQLTRAACAPFCRSPAAVL